MENKLELDAKNKKVFKFFSFLIFTIFILGSIYFAYRILFPSEYFTQSFQNMNSLRNTITDVSKTKDSVSFFASTSQDFSEIKIDIELEKKSAPLIKSSLGINKSYKSFFYPEISFSDGDLAFNENIIVASPDSIFILNGEKKNPIDNPLTFIGLGYSWENIESDKIDLGDYEKDKLLNITSAHPNGTILFTDKNNYYLIKDGSKKELGGAAVFRVKDFKNNIYVQETSLITQEDCYLKNSFIFKRKYSCTAPLEKISKFSGKDYLFELSGISEDVEIKKIDLEFKKTLNKDNLFIFLADIKNKLRARFTGEQL